MLAAQGAKEIILFVDQDAPEDPDHNRDPAIALYLSEGLQVVGHLWSYAKKGGSNV